MKENKVSDYEQLLNSEIEKRLNAMENPEYIFNERFNKKDYIFTALVVIFCLIFLILGANF